MSTEIHPVTQGDEFMSLDMSDPHVQALAARAQLPDGPNALALGEQIAAACRPMAQGTAAILELSRAGLHKTADGNALGTVDVLLAIFPLEIAIVQPKGVFKKTWNVQRIDYDSYADALADQKSYGDQGKAGEFAIQFTGAGSVPIFRLGWSWFRRAFSDGVGERLKAAEERDRVLAAITAAKTGDFTRWGQVMNRPEDFDNDFRSAYTRLVSEGPADARAVREWATDHIGSYAYPSALASAIEWREDELRDQRPRQARGGVSARVARIISSGVVIDKIPAAKSVFLQLGEALYTEGELAGPYHERADFGPDVKDEPDRQLSPLDPGPSRLGALMLLGVYGHDVGHPRTTEWIAAARAGLATVSSSALPQHALRAWSLIERA
jgi:hypothetical protein